MADLTRDDAPVELLEDSTLMVKKLIQKTYNTFVRLSWAVQNYSALQKNVIYCKAIENADFKWIFRLVKSKGTLFLSLETNVPGKKMSFSVISFDRTVTSKDFDGIEISSGLYVAEFCNEAIMNPDAKFLLEGVLTFTCRYPTRPVEVTCVSLPYNQFENQTDVHEFCDNLKILFLKDMNVWPADFTIYARKTPFYVHKLILCARSTYFKKLFDADDALNNSRTELIIDIDYEHLLSILVYIYSGELRDMPVKPLIEIFSFACSLKIPGLIRRCMVYLKDGLSLDNAYDILEATEKNCEELKNDVVAFLKWNDPEIVGNKRPYKALMEKLRKIKAAKK